MRQGDHNPPLFVRLFGRGHLKIADRLGDLVLFGLPDAPGLIARPMVPSSATSRAACQVTDPPRDSPVDFGSNPPDEEGWTQDFQSLMRVLEPSMLPPN